MTAAELAALARNQIVWLAGLRAGRDSVYFCETAEEAEAQSPYLVDGQDPIDLMLERIAELEKED